MNASVDYAMIVLFAVYAVTFFLMGALVWLRLERTARIGIVAPLVLFVVFAMLHGASDALDVVLRLPAANPSPVGAIAAARIILLVASFVFLLLYGVTALIDDVARIRSVFMVGMIALVGVIAALAGVFAEGIEEGSITLVERSVRLFIAFPASLLSAVALGRIGARLRRLGLRQCSEGAYVAAVGLALYAVFSGLVATGYPDVVRLVGLPIQAYRMAAAVVITLGLALMLERMSVSSPPKNADQGAE